MVSSLLLRGHQIKTEKEQGPGLLHASLPYYLAYIWNWFSLPGNALAIWEILNSSLQLHRAQNLQAPKGFHTLFAAREGGGLSSFFISSLILPHIPPALSRPLPVHLTRGVSQSERSRSCNTSTTTSTRFYYLTWSITIRTKEEETPASASFPTARLIFCFLNLIFYSSRDI